MRGDLRLQGAHFCFAQTALVRNAVLDQLVKLVGHGVEAAGQGVQLGYGGRRGARLQIARRELDRHGLQPADRLADVPLHRPAGIHRRHDDHQQQQCGEKGDCDNYN